VRAPILHVLRGVGTIGTITLVLIGSGLLGRPILSCSGGPKRPSAAELTAASGSIGLVSQAPAFVTSQSGVSLEVNPASSVPAGRLAIDMTLYSKATYPSVLQEALSGNLSDLTPLQQASIPLTTKGLHWSSGKSVTLVVPISAPDLSGKSRTGTDGTSFALSCEPPYCGGVYPLQVALFDVTLGLALRSFTTYVIITPPSETANTKALEFAWTVPLGQTPAISPTGEPTPDSTDISELNMLDSVLSGAPGAALTLDLFPQLAESMNDGKDAADQEALQELRFLASGSHAAVVPGTFTPTFLDALASSTVPNAVASQISRARAVTGALMSFDNNEYIANAPISAAALHQLSAEGISQVLVPSDGAAPLSTYFRNYTPTRPFLIPNAGVIGIASDPELEDDLTSSVGPALKAQQLLADLSVVYFDNNQANQVMALDTPTGMQLDQSFLSDVLDALSTSPIVKAVTLPDVFKTVPPGPTETSPGTRGLRSVPVTSEEALPSADIIGATSSLAAYSSMLPSQHRAKGLPPLSDLILMSETVGFSLSQRGAYLNYLDGKAESVSHYLSLPFGHVITVTSLKATIPISILSTSPVPIVAQLSVHSLDLGFPKGHVWTITIQPRTNIVKIPLDARTAGTFSMVLTISSRTGYELQSGDVTVQSTAISGVAVALSAAAGLFLVVWWIRSIIQKRRKRHRDRGAALAAGAIPENDQVTSAVASPDNSPE
jgi:hypothetical protein